MVGSRTWLVTITANARAYYDTLRARQIGHQAALRQLANRLVASCMAV
jgi:hypothetical protein